MDIPRWELKRDGNLYVVEEDGKPTLGIPTERVAKMVMAIPKLLEFMTSFSINHPCRIDADRVLQNCGIPRDEKPKPEPELLAE